MEGKIIYPSFVDAQQLYLKYSTIENNNELQNTLLQYIDSNYLSSLTYNNIHEVYNKIILKYYPNEICIKSNFINKVLFKRKKHVTIFELPIGSSRVDLCKINGTSTAYEIKTDLDNFSRLDKQLCDYFEIFEEVCVISSLNNLDQITDIVPNCCGIYIYEQTNRGTYHFTLVRKPQKSTSLCPQKQITLLRKSEFKDYFNFPSNLNSREEIINNILNSYNSNSINKIFKTILKNRYQKQWNFLKENQNLIYELDYQWFFKNQINPLKIYK